VQAMDVASMRFMGFPFDRFNAIRRW